MTTRRWLLLVLVVGASVLAVGAAVWCAGAKQDEKVTLDQVPAAVRATIVKAAEGGKIEAIERETKDAKTVYEADLIIGGKRFEVRVASNGELLSKEADDEHEPAEETEETVTLDQLPATVKATIAKAAEGGTVQEIDKVTTDGKTVYEADVLIGGQKFEAQVALDGKLLRKAVDDEGEGGEAEEGEKTITLDQLPAAVKATVVKAAEGGRIGEIEQDVEDGKTVYEAEVTIGGKTFDIKVAPDGKLLSKEADEDDGD